jgi:MFS family permease
MYKNKTLLTTTVAATVFMFAATIYDPYFTPLLLSKGFSKETISFAFSVAPFSLIFFGSILGNFSDAVGRKRIQNFSLLSLIISLLLYLYIPKSFPLLIITALINVLAYQTFNDASAERIEDNLADEERGKETGRYLSITTFGAITAATFGTYLASRFPVTITFKLGSADKLGLAGFSGASVVIIISPGAFLKDQAGNTSLPFPVNIQVPVTVIQ